MYVYHTNETVLIQNYMSNNLNRNYACFTGYCPNSNLVCEMKNKS